MKKLLLLCLLFTDHALASRFVDWEWRLNDKGAAVVLAEAYSDKQTALFFNACAMTISLWDEAYNSLKDDQTMTVRVKVDSGQVHQLTMIQSERTRSEGLTFTIVSAFITGDLLSQMIAGNYIRVQYKDDTGKWSNRIIERYSLTGFTRVAKESLNTCDSEDAQHFGDTKSDSEFF